MTTDQARALILLDAARIANDDGALGDPDAIVHGARLGAGQYAGGVANPSLSFEARSRWFATLVETTADIAALKAWRLRTGSLHHEASEALDRVIADAADRATIAVLVLLNGEPELEAVA